MTDEHDLAAFPYSVTHRLDAVTTDSFLVSVTETAITVGKEWVQLGGLLLGPQNFDVERGPDIRVSPERYGIDVLSAGRYWACVNCQLSEPTGDGWFEPAIEPNGLSLSDWPTDMAQGHVGSYIHAEVAGWDDVSLGAQVGYTTPRLSVGAFVTTWARYGSASGAETIDVTAVIFMSRQSA